MNASTQWEPDQTGPEHAGRPPFVQIPEKIILDPTLSAQSVRVYCVLAHHVNRTSGTAWPSHRSIADYLGVKDRTVVMRYLRELQAAGWIDWRQRSSDKGAQTSNLYRLFSEPTPTGKIRHPLSAKSDRGVPAKSDTNHIELNQTEGTKPPIPPTGGNLPAVPEQLEGQTDVLELLAKEKPKRKSSRVDPLPYDDERFMALWNTYPRRHGKGEAAKALARALTREQWPVIWAGVQQFAADPNLPADRSIIPHPATWLNQDRWADDPLPPRLDGAKPAASAGWYAAIDAYNQSTPTPPELTQ